MKPTRTENLELEGLRGVACLLVALGHTLYLNHLDPNVVLPPWLRTIEASHAGVLVFFMLSGYLISWTNPGACTPASRRDYGWRRFIRLAPIYYAAIALTVAVLFLRRDGGQVRTVAATVAGLQNFNDYFGLHLPPPMSNGPLWSLNYELLYYGLFILLWRFQPALRWIFLPALMAAALGWFAPQIMPLFISSYSCGWLFWAAGWWLARLPQLPNGASRAPVATWLLLIVASDHLGGVARMLNAIGLYSKDAGMVPLSDLGLLPAILLLMAAVSRRQLPAGPAFSSSAWAICAIPLAGMLSTGRLWGNPTWITGAVAFLIAIPLLFFRSMDWLKFFAGLGRISYAFYVVHFPLLFVVQHSALPGGTVAAYFVRIIAWAILAVVLSWLLERKFQPWIKVRLSSVAPAQ